MLKVITTVQSPHGNHLIEGIDDPVFRNSCAGVVLTLANQISATCFIAVTHNFSHENCGARVFGESGATLDSFHNQDVGFANGSRKQLQRKRSKQNFPPLIPDTPFVESLKQPSDNSLM